MSPVCLLFLYLPPNLTIVVYRPILFICRVFLFCLQPAGAAQLYDAVYLTAFKLPQTPFTSDSLVMAFL